jgi:GntR family transcriptional regulator
MQPDELLYVRPETASGMYFIIAVKDERKAVRLLDAQDARAGPPVLLAWDEGGFDTFLLQEVQDEVTHHVSSNGGQQRPLPSEHELASAIGVSRPTIRQALGFLEQRSVVYKRRGIGTFRAPRSIARPPRLRSLYEELVEQGVTPVTRVLKITALAASAEVAHDLHVPEGAPLVQVERVRTVDGRPIVLHTNTLNLEGRPPPLQADLERNSLYVLLHSTYGIDLTLASQEVMARTASQYERKHLELGRQGCVLVAHRVAFDASGRGVEWAINVYPAGTHSFRMRLTVW